MMVAGDKPNEVQKAQIAEAEVAATRIYADYEAISSAIVRNKGNTERIAAMIDELYRELNRKID